jgi:hypothetical protein
MLTSSHVLLFGLDAYVWPPVFANRLKRHISGWTVIPSSSMKALTL